MTDHFLKSIEALRDEIAKEVNAINDKKKLVNMLCKQAGIDPAYTIESVEAEEAPTSIKSDQFYGRPLATAVREILEMRRKAGGEKTASVKEVFRDLVKGGYHFDTKNEDNAIRGLRVSLSKNPAFHLVGQTGRYGLTEWYPNAPKKRERDTDEENATDDSIQNENDTPRLEGSKP